MTTTTQRIASILATVSACAAAAFFAGCESDDSHSGDYWTTEAPKPAKTAPATPAASTPSQSSSSTPSSSPTPAATETPAPAAEQPAAAAAEAGAADEIDFGALRWTFGGINGGRASKTDASIGHLSARGDSMSYRWTGHNLSSWGLSNDDPGACACFFVQRSDGAWVGGKFDWVSTSRTSRGFENINSGYGGWTLAGVPNPCPCAFVIVSGDCKKRTNVIGGIWSR